MKKNFVKIMMLITVCIITITLLSGCEIKINTEKQDSNNNVSGEQKKDGYTKNELEKMALDYYEAKTGYRPSKVASEINDEGLLTIQLYDELVDHNSTSDWYTIDMKTAIGTDILGNKIDLNEKKENNSISESKKIYDKKSWVFDADYLDNKENKRKESFSSEESIKAPYININSDDAKKINNELKEMCESFYENFGTLAPMKNAITGETSYNESCFNINNLNYKAYEYDNILSIVISYGEFVVPGGIDGVSNKIYCFDLNTLKIMNVNEIIKKGGFNSINDVNIKLKDYLVKNDMPTDLEWDGERCYIDSNGIINVIIPTESMMSEMSVQLK